MFEYNKYKIYNLPLYFPYKFGENIESMILELPINENGLCLLDVDVITEQKETYELSTKTSVKAMIDTGASSCAVSQRLVDMLNLKKDTLKTIRGFEKEETFTTTIKLMIPQVSKNNVYPVSCVISQTMSETEFDVIIGADYLHYYDFERKGEENRFILKQTMSL